MEVVNAQGPHFIIIQHIAKFTWPDTFSSILSPEQIDYMLEMMYSDNALKEQVANGHQFILAIEDGTYHGFASYELNYENSNDTKIHKLYILPKSQGKGAGKLLINEIIERAKVANNTKLTLNVNRNNPAVLFYQNLGWQIVKEVDIDIQNNFYMNDYVMELSL